jgi:hypothetical protein
MDFWNLDPVSRHGMTMGVGHPTVAHPSSRDGSNDNDKLPSPALSTLLRKYLRVVRLEVLKSGSRLSEIFWIVGSSPTMTKKNDVNRFSVSFCDFVLVWDLDVLCNPIILDSAVGIDYDYET